MKRYVPKDPPAPSLKLVAHPETDSSYERFADGGRSTEGGRRGAPIEVAAKRTASAVNAWLAEAALLSNWDRAFAGAFFQERTTTERGSLSRPWGKFNALAAGLSGPGSAARQALKLVSGSDLSWNAQPGSSHKAQLRSNSAPGVVDTENALFGNRFTEA